jgi:hypothetical protein
MLNGTSLGSKSAAANIGLPGLRCNFRCSVCKARGVTKRFRKVPYVWRGTVCERNMFRRLPHQGTIVRTSVVTSVRNIWASRWCVSKQNWKFSIFHKIIMYNYELRSLTGFLNARTIISVVSPPKCHSIHYLILFGSRNIKVFCKTC